MHDILSPVRRFLKVGNVCIDNSIFRLHYKATMFVLIVFSLLVTQTQYWGDPMDCLSGSSIDSELLDSFCWIQSTFTLPNAKHGPYAGVYSFSHPTQDKYKVKHHNYYQWIAIILCFQALSFYIPHYLWMIWEGGKLEMLASGLQYPVINEKELKGKKEVLVTFFKANLHNNEAYAYKFICCEILNFVNIVMQIILTNEFVGKEFSDYGIKVVGESQSPFFDRDDPLEYVFPKVTKCSFYTYGPSGTEQNVDALCVLPGNIFNEKIYIFLWFWFIGIAILSGLALVYRLATFVPVIQRKLLAARAKIVDINHVTIVTAHCRFGDWFLLYQIAKNVDLMTFKDCMDELAMNMKCK